VVWGARRALSECTQNWDERRQRSSRGSHSWSESVAPRLHHGCEDRQGQTCVWGMAHIIGEEGGGERGHRVR